MIILIIVVIIVLIIAAVHKGICLHFEEDALIQLLSVNINQ